MGRPACKLAWGIAAALLVGCQSEPAPRPAAPENVILISIDTLRADHVGAYGYELPTTPRIDELARDGVLFRTCVAHAASTLYSHASILTSLLPIHHGATIHGPDKIAADSSPVAEMLRDAGFRTGSFNGGGQLDAAYGVDRGFDVYVSARPPGGHPDHPAPASERTAVRVADALEWIDSGAEPFFLFLHSYEIHHPYTPISEHIAAVGGFDYAGDLPNAISFSLINRINRGYVEITPEDREHIVRMYDAELHSADAAIGELLDGLRERGLYDSTLVVFTSDHGEEFGEHGNLGTHAHALYDELIRVPLIVKFPRSAYAGRVIEAQVRGIDVAPTILAAVGIDRPESYQGTDVFPLVAGEESAERPSLSELEGPHGDRWSVRSDGFKFMHLPDGEQLFALADDASEQRDVAERDAEVADRLRALGKELMDRRPLPETEPAHPSEENLDALRAMGYID